MKLGVLLTLNAMIALMFGLTSIFIPEIMLTIYGAETIGTELVQMTRLFGSVVLGYAVLSWLARNAEGSDARQAILLAFIISYLFGLIVTLFGFFSGVMGMIAWLNVVLYLIFISGYGYFRFAKQD
uniref:Uncharacterized protein n=1 Tax=Candidatus Kentrum sp. LFY TaxID=2126342 RepID=A0A450U4X4_9GAMM|nr:MAG: hypothetical protein BECKLFY1418B_GA0070995_100167 [Candidatus Kentron sp. LFY]VFJ89870.1 MAG: hypothetical protein BECKLFY1418A_GA0070994_100913 [Candidatus Kentron sp. LFY]VFK15424.1 MAG: hypothetical protein BECKLFY1418C_GA0070996_101520 [Candidatus Kentron sp. LFY]